MNPRNKGKFKDERLKKINPGLKLPAWLIEELDKLPGSRPVLIEEACINYFRLEPPKISK